MKKILILTANPKNTDKLRLDEEVREIQAGLERAQKRDQFEAFTSQTGTVTTGDLKSSGTTAGGDITIKARTSITSGKLDSSSSLSDGGNVFLAPENDIKVTEIDAEGGTTGGTVDITTNRFFRATDTFIAANGLNASISTIGGSSGGNITIRHGGNGVTPFNVGDATTNGTAGAITTGNFTIAPNQSFPYTYTLGNIRIISVNSPINPVDLLETPKKPVTGISINQIPALTIDTGIGQLEQSFTSAYQTYLGISEPTNTNTVSLPEAQFKLQQIEKTTGIKPAIIYVFFGPESNQSQATPSQIKQDSDQLELLLVTTNSQPVWKRIPSATRASITKLANEFRDQVSDPSYASDSEDKTYQNNAQKLYKLIIAPLEQDLKAQKIENLTFALDAGLRQLPLAALQDDKEKFLVEKYSVGLMPSLSLTDTRYVSIKNSQALAMGRSDFKDINLNPLAAVPVELSNITNNFGSGNPFLDKKFTLNNLQSQRAATPFSVIHLATHGKFETGDSSNSYIQLWDQKLPLKQIRNLRWNNPPVELLVLSACYMAVGDDKAELGFAGAAAHTGVKSVVASLWSVSDEGTLGLMTQFYHQLKSAPIKAEALRQAQIAMLNGQVYLEKGQLHWLGGTESLPPNLSQNKKLSHPYYWSAFTMIGNPW